MINIPDGLNSDEEKVFMTLASIEFKLDDILKEILKESAQPTTYLGQAQQFCRLGRIHVQVAKEVSNLIKSPTKDDKEHEIIATLRANVTEKKNTIKTHLNTLTQDLTTLLSQH